jgi:chemotaxis protein CheD
VSALLAAHPVCEAPPHLVVLEPPAYVHPGQVAVSVAPGSLVTILGSCVAVCLHDAIARVGGMNHFLLPHPGSDAEPSTRYAQAAIDHLISQMVVHGARLGRLEAHVVGGASVLAAFKNDENHLGKRNVSAAYDILTHQGIAIASSDVGGIRGRKLVFDPRSGARTIHLLGR